MSGHDIIVIGTSAGGVEVLQTLVKNLPADLPAAIFIVMHMPAQSPSLLAHILDRAGSLPVVIASHLAIIEPSHIYVAVPDHHLLIEDGHMLVVNGPKENRHRPAIDPLFRTAARFYGSRVVGVVLTGSLDDGTAGMLAIKQQGGICVIQDPHEALYPSMPNSVLQHAKVDYSLPATQISTLLIQLAQTPVPKQADYTISEQMDYEIESVKMEDTALLNEDRPGTPSVFSCPECHGVLWELHDGELVRFRCRVGHAFSIESMMAEQADALEEALWSALKTLEESISLSKRMLERATERNQHSLAKRYHEKIDESEQRANLIRQVLIKDHKKLILNSELITQ